MSSVIALSGCVVAGGLAGLAGGYFGAELRGADLRSEITTQRLVIVNDAGQVWGGLEGGRGSSSDSAHFYLGGPTPDGPKVIISVDNLEGTPTASVLLRSTGLEKGEIGVANLRSVWGKSQLSLSEPGPPGVRQTVEFGTSQIGQQTVLRLVRDAQQVAAWPE